MRAMACREFGPPENLIEIELPSPEIGPHEVLVRVQAVGVNFTDILAMGGRSQLKRSLPFVPGVEAAGEVVAVGSSVTKVNVGERVFGVRVSGTYAEEVVFKENEVFAVPDTMPMTVACTFYVVSMTAYYSLVTRANLKAGENLLVLGAGGGAGLAAIDIGKAIGARVVAAASSEDKLALARARGADACIRYPREGLDIAAQKKLADDFLAQSPRKTDDGITIGEINSVHEKAGYHVIFDGVGGGYAEPAMRSLGWHGRYLSVGFAAGVPKISLGPLLFKDADVFGIQPGDDHVRLPGRAPAMMADLTSWYEQGFLEPQITGTYPMEEAPKVLRLMADRKITGRIVLTTRHYQK
jgi:NADPH:quinone reductase